MGIKDKTLAEFVIALIKPNDDLEKFKEKIFKLNASMTLTLIESIYKLTKTMLPNGKVSCLDTDFILGIYS